MPRRPKGSKKLGTEWANSLAAGVARHLQRVIDLTREVYGGFSDVSVSVDPEIPDDTHIVFRVPVRCSIEEALDLDEEWGRRIMEIIPRSPQVYLTSLDFQP